jgi:RNA polymerase sigma factor (sigma-70 family)
MHRHLTGWHDICTQPYESSLESIQTRQTRHRMSIMETQNPISEDSNFGVDEHLEPISDNGTNASNEILHDKEYDNDDEFPSGHEDPQFQTGKSKGRPLTSEKEYELINAYCNEIGRQHLFTQKEEIEVSAQIKICEEKTKQLTSTLERLSKKGPTKRLITLKYLIMLYSQKAKQLKERFIKANLKLVFAMANKYRSHRHQVLDLIQEGNIGLIKAVERFDYRRGNRFSTYASWWIHQALIRAVYEQTRTIKIPVYLLEQKNKIHRTISAIQRESGRTPLSEEIAQRAHTAVEVVNLILDGIDTKVFHLDSPISIDDTTPILDMIQDDSMPAPDQYTTNTELIEKLDESMSKLSDRERRIISSRFGIGHQTPHTLDEIGKIFNVTRERIRQIEKGAFKKLANSESGTILRSFLYQ